MLWIVPIYFFVFVADEILGFFDHVILIVPDENADAHRLVTFRPTWLEAVLFSPHQMNYHAEHHLWPFVPYYHLPRLSEFVEKVPGITVRRSYLRFLVRIQLSSPVQSHADRRKALA